jgi:hypothetical protein
MTVTLSGITGSRSASIRTSCSLRASTTAVPYKPDGSANCEDDAKGLGRALSGDGRADTYTAFRVGRVSYRFMYNEIYVG